MNTSLYTVSYSIHWGSIILALLFNLFPLFIMALDIFLIIKPRKYFSMRLYQDGYNILTFEELLKKDEDELTLEQKKYLYQYKSIGY